MKSPLEILAILLLLTGELTAATYPITYRLAKAGKVSLNVYDANGGMVREIQHALPQSAGNQTLFWDGLDREGRAVRPGNYTWKLLQTPGLSAQYQLSLGMNYPIGTDLASSGGPGTHNAPYTVAVDDTGIYIAANQTENLETCLLKLSPDRKTRLWSQTLPSDEKNVPVAWEGARSIAVDRGEVYLLGHFNPQRLHISNATNGAAVRAFSVIWEGDPSAPADFGSSVQDGCKHGATDMDVSGGVLVVAYHSVNAIRWYDPSKGTVLTTTTNVAAPGGLAVGSNGVVYVTTGNKVVSITQANPNPVDVITSGLTEPGRIDVDAATGELVVFDAGTQQVKRFSPAGALLKTYGAAGGRQDGLYMNRDFSGVTDVCADGHGGFCIAESFTAPRRVTHFDRAGSVIREWYGGQPWAPHAAFEPGNPGVMWMTSAYSRTMDVRYIMRLLVDYTNKTWQVHSCYKYASPTNPLMGVSGNEGNLFHIYQHAGTKYLAIEGPPCITRIDEQNWKLMPVTAFGKDFQWNDQNGDGLVQDVEKTPSTNRVAAVFQVSHLAADFDHYFIDGASQVRRTRVAGWNSVGAPLYTTAAPEVYAKMPPRFLAHPYYDGRWSAFLRLDPVSHRLYAALNTWFHDWCTSADSFMQQWNAKQQITWCAGEQGPASRFWMGQYHPTEPGFIAWNLRGLAGIAHGCIVAIDVNGGWTAGQRANTYVWDQDGLFVGGLMDKIDLNGIPEFMYRCGGEFCHSSVHTLPNGDVLFAGNWESDVRVYKITGWNNWTRQSGKLKVKSPATDDTGAGLMAEYFDKPTFTKPRTVQVDGPIDFTAGLKKFKAVRWRGSVQPTYGPRYTGFWMTEAADTNCYDSTSHRARDIDAQVECKFRGSSIRVIGLKSTNCGYANIYLDGTQVVTDFDTYSSNTIYNATFFEKSGLANSDHIVTVTAVGYGRRNPAAGDSYVCLDSFVVDGVPIDDHGLPYTFSVNSDAGTQLWVNKASITNNTPVKLQRKQYPIQLNVFKDTGNAKVTLSWSSPLDVRQPVPAAALFPASR